MKIKKLDDFMVTESTSHYLPSFSDDGTADRLSEINSKVSKIVNSELKKCKKDVLTHRYDTSIRSEFQQEIIQQWMYANMIMTSLKNGFNIDKELIDEAVFIYEKIIAFSLLEDFDEEWVKEFKTQIKLILKRIGELEISSDGDYYSPHFMKEDVEKINKKLK